MVLDTASKTDKAETKVPEVKPMLGEEKIEPTGKKCVVCGFEVVEKFVYEILDTWDIGEKEGFVSKGKYCNNKKENCGLKYEF